MKLSIMTRVYWNCYQWPGRTFNFTLRQILRRIALSGYEAVDLCEYPLEFWPLSMGSEDAKRLKNYLSELNLKVSGITIPTFAPGLELIPVEEDRETLIKRFVKAIELVSYLEGETVMYGINPIPVFGISRSDAYKWTLEVFRRCVPVAEDHGVSIAIEFLNDSFPTSNTILDFLEAVGSENVGVCLEVGNVRARPRSETLEQHIDACKQWIKLVHVIDPVNERWNASVGVDLPGVLDKLRRIKYRGYIVTEGFARNIECERLDEEVALSHKYLLELIRTLSHS